MLRLLLYKILRMASKCLVFASKKCTECIRDSVSYCQEKNTSHERKTKSLENESGSNLRNNRVGLHFKRFLSSALYFTTSIAIYLVIFVQICDASRFRATASSNRISFQIFLDYSRLIRMDTSIFG